MMILNKTDLKPELISLSDILQNSSDYNGRRVHLHGGYIHGLARSDKNNFQASYMLNDESDFIFVNLPENTSNYLDFECLLAGITPKSTSYTSITEVNGIPKRFEPGDEITLNDKTNDFLRGKQAKIIAVHDQGFFFDIEVAGYTWSADIQKIKGVTSYTRIPSIELRGVYFATKNEISRLKLYELKFGNQVVKVKH